MTVTRRLAAILAAEVVGYSRLIGADEEGTIQRLKTHRRALVDPKIAQHNGRIVKITGDGMLVEFASSVEAVRCAVEVQRGMIDRDVDTVADRRIAFRVGVNFGEVIADGRDLVSRYVAALPVGKLATLIEPGTMIYGDGVNIAARLATLSEPGGICVSDTIHDHIRDTLSYTFEDIGEPSAENVARPMQAYAMSPGAVASTPGEGKAELGLALLYAMSVDAVVSTPGVVPQPHRRAALRGISLQSAVIAASVVATIGIWIVAWWASLGGSLWTAPTQVLVAVNPQIPPVIATGGEMAPRAPPVAQTPPVGSIGGGTGTQAPSAPQSPFLGSTAGDTGPRAPPAPQSPPLGSTAGDAGPQAPPAPAFSIVVLPFANLSNDPNQEYFADAITGDVTSDLSRISGSFVIARNTAFTYKGRPVDAAQLRHELGIRYVLEGGVERSGDQVRVSAQLFDAEAGKHPWADWFETDRTHLAEAQNEIIGRIARALNLEFVERASSRIEQERAVDPDAGDLVMRGWAWYHRPYSTATWQEAQRVFERALEMDPRSVDARIGLATVLGGKLANGWSNSLQPDTARAEQLLQEVLERDPNSSMAHFAIGVLRRMQNRLTEARIEYETTIALNGNHAHALLQLGQTLMLLGRPEAGIPHIEKAIRLDPHDPNMTAFYWALGTCHLLLGNVDEAIDLLRKARAANSRLWFPHLYLAGAFGLRGELDDARTALARSIKLKPAINSLARMRVYNPWITNPPHWALQEQTLNVGLRRAGLPDQ